MKIIINIIVTIVAIIGFCAMYIEVDANEANLHWTSETYKKYDNLVSIGFSKQMSTYIINSCKRSKKNPVMCIKIMSSKMGAESSMGKRCYMNNCLGMNDGGVAYSSIFEGLNEYVIKFDTFWYKQKDPSSFYRADGIPPITHYCMGKKRDGVCKEGTKNSWAVFKKLNF